MWSPIRLLVPLVLCASSVSAQDIPSDCDCWLTEPGTQVRLPDFAPGFFGPGSLMRPSEVIDVESEPLPPAVVSALCPPQDTMQVQWFDPHGTPVAPDDQHRVRQEVVVADIDTVVCRPNDANFAGPGVPEPVDIQLVELSLVSVMPIAVDFSSGPSPRFFDVFVTEEGAQPVGTMTLTPTFVGPASSQGQMFLDDLPVDFQLTFREVNGGPLNANLGGLNISFTGSNGLFRFNGGAGIPTMGEYGLGALIVLMLGAGVVFVRRQL